MSKYKKGVITTLLHSARKISSDDALFLCEVDRIKQWFVNNNYTMSVINDCVKTYLHKFRYNINSTENTKEQLKTFYENQMNSQYKKDEK